MAKVKRAFEYSRGDEYRVDILIAEDDSFTYANEAYPETVDKEILAQFYDEAEKAVTKVLDRERNGGS